VRLSLPAHLGLTYVFVSHDMAQVRQLAHTDSVMHRGHTVEHGTVTDIFENPRQPYARSLLASIPSGIAGVPHVPQPHALSIITAD
jgi:peptide/nickel transport system ATP-binding protein